MYYDGHVHTPFCPHGSKDTLEMYIERAISLGIKGITFTEHAPLPKTFTDPAPTKDSAMLYDQLGSYFEQIKELKKFYEKEIEIYTGLEVDFIDGYEDETGQLLKEVWPELDDAILSVHFLQIQENYYCMDYDENVFKEMINKTGTLSALYSLYFETVKKSIVHSFGKFQPKRIGHITLAKKFQTLFPAEFSIEKEIDEVLTAVSERSLTLDYNGAGAVKPYCLEPYPSNWIVKEAQKRKIPLVYGSDAHSAKGLGQGFHQLVPSAALTSPLLLNRAE
ncbi:histidinol-phosphatase HisJ [Fictibacillus sp. UD]|uniref:histidinol-phosphatase HisJ n=1 Tax=Fictibacillus sp. UD TaxID=3038777 RepID=UPI00374671E0